MSAPETGVERRAESAEAAPAPVAAGPVAASLVWHGTFEARRRARGQKPAEGQDPATS